MTALRRIFAFTLALVMLFGATTVYASDTSSAKDEMPYTDFSGTFNAAYVSTVTAYHESSAPSNIPSGFSGYVLHSKYKADGGYCAIELDYSEQEIPMENIDKITFRVFLPTGHTEMRLLGAKSTTWVMRAAPETMGAWCDMTLNSESANFSLLGNDAGNLGRICLIARLNSGTDKSFYLDAITIKYKSGASGDTTPPVITYNGPTTVDAYAGNRFSLSGVSAYDNEDKTSAAISYEWSAGAVDSDGRLQAGVHTCTVKATDRSGNTSTITLTVRGIVDESLIVLDSVPYCNYIQGVSIYNATVTDLSFNSATSKGVPSGFSGNVLEVKGTSARFGMTFDPTSLGIPVDMIERITFRFYFRDTKNAIRFSNHGESDWNVLANATANQWMEYTITRDGSGMSNGYKLDAFENDDGTLGVFAIATKYETSTDYTFYIDHVQIQLKKNDGKAPELKFDGVTDILTSSGKPFRPDITAYDHLLECEIPLNFEWSAGAIDTDGNMLEGVHTCVVSATNYYGNTASVTLNVTVGPPDVEAPEILFTTSEIYVPTGTFYRMVMECVDNYDRVDVVSEWSEGAVDFGFRLAKGTHTLTLTATDDSGNKSVHVVTVYVTDDDPVRGSLVQCGE